MNGDIIGCLLVTFSILSGWIAAAICNVKWASFLDETTDKWNELCEKCPLIEVPTPHGRLIDADALMLSILDAQVDQPELAEVYDEDYHVVLDWLRAAPTVIEAEE